MSNIVIELDQIIYSSGNMALIIGYISNQIFEILEKRDTRIDHLPFTSPLSVILILTSYVCFVKKLGPSFMRKREPFALQKVIIIYDLIQIILNFALFAYAMYSWYNYKPDFNFACQPIDRGTSVIAIKEIESVYYFYCLKLLDLCDTVFFVLRKKTRQVSFLHVYHHLAVVIFTYKAVGWSPGGQFVIIGLFNSVVHTVMYTYYLVSAYEPQMKENVKIKKFVTKIQMTQFVILMFFFGRPLLDPDCPIPKFFLLEIVFQNVVLFCLFSNFYYRNYFCAKKMNKKL